MKRFIPYLALVTMVALAGCSGDSPRPAPVPTVVPEAWSITSLTVTPNAPYVGTDAVIEAVVTQDGSPAPDDTSVRFTSNGEGAFSNGLTEASVLTKNGRAVVLFSALLSDTYTVIAQVQNAQRSTAVTFQDFLVTDQLQLISLTPSRGSYDGGENVEIRGIGIKAPVEVYFDLQGTSYQGVVLSLSDFCVEFEGTECAVFGQQLFVQTPSFTGANTSVQQTADVRVASAVGLAEQQTATLLQSFVLIPGQGTAIFGVSPSSGRSSGGEIVNILGQGFGTVSTDLGVTFTFQADIGGTLQTFVLPAVVLGVSPDGSQIQVETPRFSTIPLDLNIASDVTVTTPTAVAVLPSGFIILADNPVPEIASVSPIAGPIDGGTLVTIFGSGFQIPMQVTFGDLAATDVNVFNDTTPADNDRITCVTPDYSQQGVTPPFAADVTVTNMTSGNDATRSAAFSFGDPLYVTGNSPDRGQPGDLVIIYGSGFEDPLQVFYPAASTNQMEVVSVSGTELVVRIPDDVPVECADSTGLFSVLLLESNLTADGGSFTLLGNSPLVLSTDPVIFQVDNLVDLNLVPNDMIIRGEYFAQNILVTIGTYVVPSGNIDVVSDRTIDVFNLPNLNDLGVVFSTTSCVIPPDIPGQQQTSTVVDVSVRNFPGDCENTLVGAFVVEPPSTSCEATPANIVTNPQGTWTFPDTQAGGNSPTLDLLVFNLGGEDAENLTFTYAGTEFNPVSDTCPPDLAFNTGCNYSMEFTPNSAGAKAEQLTISYDSALEGPKVEVISLVGTGTP